MNIKIFFSIIIYLLLFILLNCAFQIDKLDVPNKKYDLKKDGFIVIKNILKNKEIYELQKKCNENEYYDIKKILINNDNLLNIIKNNIKNNNYVFQDYIWIIKKSSVHTCHRDNNGDFFNVNQKYPSYTLLIYLEDTEKCLGVIPNSHKYKNSYNININNAVKYLPCKKGDAILFNANLIHVGSINKYDNLRIQMKISHKNDLGILSYYQKYNKILNTENKLPFIIKHIQKNFSCLFPFISNLTQNENIRTSRGSNDGVKIGILQKIFSYFFYGNSNFYDLPNAF